MYTVIFYYTGQVMKLFKKVDYFSVLSYAVLFSLFTVFGKLEEQVYPYSIALFTTAVTLGANPFITPIVFLSSFLVVGEVGLLASASLPCVLFMAIIPIYKKAKVTPRAEVVAFTALSTLLFVFLGNTTSQVVIEKRILVSVVTVLISVVTLIAGNAVTKKGLKFKWGFEEGIALAVTTALLGLGVSNLFSPFAWKTVSVFIILCSAYVYKSGKSLIFACVLGFAPAIYYSNVSYVAVYLIFALVSESFMPFTRYASVIAVLATDYLVFAIFGVYGAYNLSDFIFTLIGATCFCIIPLKILKDLKEKLYSFREKQLARQSINRCRVMTSNRLFELAGVFTEMANSFSIFKQKEMNEEKAKQTIRKEILSCVCLSCENFAICKTKKVPNGAELDKLIEVGFAKGKLSLIDFPRELGNACVKPNNILFALNKRLGEYRAVAIENMNLSTGRALIADEAQGVSEILRGLALETGTLLKYQSRLERTICDSLLKSGFPVSEILIYGENERLTVSIVLTVKEFSLPALENALSKIVGMPLSAYEKSDITDDKCYLSFRRSSDYDAVFGIASLTKDGSDKCGDTHSVIRLKEDKFMVALSDGMGSGKQAETVSSASLSLIESFYKAGLNSELILNTVNRLLAINTEDFFTALDISVIDLKTCTADFIKYGSPYGFIIGESGIRIIEGNSLPLGILEELKPAVCTTELSDGDIVLFLSDGVSDAFGSSGEILDYLRTVPAKNPQALADGIVGRALELSDGKKNDDMTAVAVRIFKRNTKTA